MSLDSTAYERSVYTVWDWMGDVGGLYGTLAIIGHYIVTLMSYVTGHGIVKEIIESLYRREAQRSSIDVNDIGTWMRNRRPLKFNSFSLLRCSKADQHSRLRNKVEKELDVVRFLRKQMIDKI